MPDLSKTARPRSSAASLPVSLEQTGSSFLQRCWTSSCPNPPALRSSPCRFQNRTEFRPIHRRCPPDTGRQRRPFFCSFFGTRSASASRYGYTRFPAASGAVCQVFAGRIAPRHWRLYPRNPQPSPQRQTVWTRG